MSSTRTPVRKRASRPATRPREAFDQLLIENSSPGVVHALRELRAKSIVADSPTMLEAIGECRNVLAHVDDDARDRCSVGGSVAGKQRRAFRGQREVPRGRVVVEDAACRHRAKPFTDIALLESGACAQLLDGGGTSRRSFEQTRPVTDVDEVREHCPGIDLKKLGTKLASCIGICHECSPEMRKCLSIPAR
jgi:hypothetical protein